jgi:segregation and condensation protein B
MTEEQYLTSKVEALVLASPEPLPTKRIVGVLNDLTPSQVARSIAALNTAYASTGSSFRIREVAGGYQYYIMPEYEGVVESLFTKRRNLRLSRAALETAAVVAYRQPTTKVDIEHIRGVASDGVIRTLMEKNLIRITGRADTVGKPLQYGTTDEFLKFFGLARLEDLPKMSEIEEMIQAEEPRRQTELELPLDIQDQPLKLNVADGTYDPTQRERMDEDEPDDIEDADLESLAVAGKLMLKRGGEDTESSEDEVIEQDEIDVVEQPAVAGES